MVSKLVVGITGASGVIYALRLIEKCDLILKKYDLIDIVYTSQAERVAYSEMGLSLRDQLSKIECIHGVYREDNWDSPLASSSNLVEYDGVIVPASLNTIAKLSCGIQDNLLLRVFSSLLRLRRRVVIVVRDTPLSTIDLRNLYRLSLSGAIILPAIPAFYVKPVSIDELIDFIIGKILDVLGVPHDLYRRWG